MTSRSVCTGKKSRCHFKININWKTFPGTDTKLTDDAGKMLVASSLATGMPLLLVVELSIGLPSPLGQSLAK